MPPTMPGTRCLGPIPSLDDRLLAAQILTELTTWQERASEYGKEAAGIAQARELLGG